MPLADLADAIATSGFDLLSTDLFDTVVLRDHTIETDRMAQSCRLVAPQLGVDQQALTRLRWTFQDNAYRAVSMERPEGEASLASICGAMARALGLGDWAAQAIRQAEVGVDIQHLRPNRQLLKILNRAARSGLRVVAVSDTYYERADLLRILDTVVGAHPIEAVYSSAELGLTKHAGRIFDEVARREGLVPHRILHVGDNESVDVKNAQAASWAAVYLPRNSRFRATKLVGQALSLRIKMERAR